MASKLLGLCSVILAAIVVSAETEYGSRYKNSIVELNFLQEKTYPNLTSIIKAGGYRAMGECRKLFKNEIWNCTIDNRHMIKELPSFVKPTVPYATREIAFIISISTAAVINEVAQQCQRSRIPGCSCDLKKEDNGNEDFQWGGCGDNVKFGEKEARRFINVFMNGNNARKAFHFHNSEVGRKVVRLSRKKVCKCNGLSGSCTAKICWRQMEPFEVIGKKLKLKYKSALRVWYANNKLHERGKNKLTAEKREKKLVYLDPSPDYCVFNKTLGSPGMLGRICRSDEGTTVKKCRSLCNACKLKHHTVQVVKEDKCRCRFVWCCNVECDTCTSKYHATTCVA
ncbi:protein Wnt-2-like [Pocillopora verrucosa]|uniref:protein Wnt-2-like n=1 Tax=Pocillopora verrucosa TaxID=203993 RepID=UPI0033405AB6